MKGKLEDDVKNKDASIEETKAKFDKLHNKIKFKSFGKVTIIQNRKEGGSKKIEEDNNDEDDDAKAQNIWKEQVTRAEEEINEIDKLRNGKVGKIWEAKKRIVGGKKGAIQATAIVNPETGKLAVSKEEILKTTLKYCEKTLKNNEPTQDFKEERIKKKEEVANYLHKKEGLFTASKETFYLMIAKFKKSRKKNYDFLTKASQGLQEEVFNLCVRMFEEEKFPQDFQYTTLHMIFKGGKGRKEILSDSRFIHCKDFWARTAEGLIVEDGLKGPLIDMSSIYQIGGQKS